MKNYNKHILSTLTILSFFFLLIATGEDNSGIEESISDMATDVEITALQLHEAYESNEVSADLNYKGKVLSVAGEIYGIKTNSFTDEIYVELKGEYIGQVDCYFADSHKQEAANLSKGQIVTIKGLCDGKMISVRLNGCSLE